MSWISRERLGRSMGVAIMVVLTAAFVSGCGSDSISPPFYPAVEVRKAFVAQGGSVTVTRDSEIGLEKAPSTEFIDLRHKISMIVVLDEVDTRRIKIGVVGYRPARRLDHGNVILIYRNTPRNRAFVTGVLTDLQGG